MSHLIPELLAEGPEFQHGIPEGPGREPRGHAGPQAPRRRHRPPAQHHLRVPGEALQQQQQPVPTGKHGLEQRELVLRGQLFVPWMFCSELLQQGLVDDAQSHQSTVGMLLQQLFQVSISQNESSASVLKMPCSASSGGVSGEKSDFLQCALPIQNKISALWQR